MKEAPCEQCGYLWPEDELLQREDNGQMSAQGCSLTKI